MSDLYRSAISARLSKLPQLPPLASSGDDIEDDNEAADEEADSIGSLPGSGMGPPAMQVHITHSAHTKMSLIYKPQVCS